MTNGEYNLLNSDVNLRRIDRKSLWHEACGIWNMAWQVSLSTFCRLALGTISTAFVGHLGSDELGGAALAGIWISGTQVLLYGFAVALSTLCSQAYGAKNFELVGVWFQLSMIFITIFCIPVMISFFYVDKILYFASSDPKILAMACTYAKYSALSVWPQCAYSNLRQYLQSMEVVFPATIVSSISLIVCFGANYIFIYGIFGWSGFGFIGSPIATFLSACFQAGALYFYACWWKGYHKETWYGWSIKECLQLDRIRRFLNMSIGMSLNMALDEWVYAAVTCVASLLGTAQIAANSVLFNLWGLMFALFWGFGCPTQIRVANRLGASQPGMAKVTMCVGFLLGAISAFVASVFAIIFRTQIAMFYSSDPTIVGVLVRNIPIFSVAVFMSALHLTLAAVVEAMSLAKILVLVTGATSWLILFPASYILGISLNYGIDGVWMGSVIGETFKFLAIALVLCRIDWNEMSLLAVSRSEGEYITEDDVEMEILNRASLLGPSSPIMIGAPSSATSLGTPRLHHHNQFNNHRNNGKTKSFESYGTIDK